MNNVYEKGSMRIKGTGDITFNPDSTALRLEIDKAIAIARDQYEQDNNIKIGIYPFLEEKCNISQDTYKKMQSTKYKNKWTREMLGKLCVGLGMSIDEANELFLLQGGKLNETNALDKIIYCALRDKDNIYDFCEEVLEYTGRDIESFKK